MKEKNIFQVLIFLCSVAMLLLALSFFIPEKGLNLHFFTFKFISPAEIATPKEQEKKDISNIIDQVMATLPQDLEKKKNKNFQKGNFGTKQNVNYKISKTTQVHKTTGSTAYLHQFFEKLNQLNEGKRKIRVLHFGDSQIEGDRMTGYIRQRMQEQFGGSGPGLIPATNVYPTLLFQQSYSENFLRFTCFGGPRLANRKYGVFNSAARFTAEIQDSTITIDSQGWIEIRPGSGAYNRAKTYNNVKMFYNSCTVPCNVKVFQGNTLIHEEDLITDGASHTMALRFSTTPSSLRYVFTSRISPNINGFSLEGDYGLQIDNIGMRGSSGTFFGAINQTSFANMLNELNVEMVIMQFGGNSMPAMKDSADVREYVRFFQGQLQTLRKLKPNLAIFVIGPSDMSKLVDGRYETYPLLPYCVKQMKKVSLATNASFWDMFEAMGGKNSMPAWVEKDLGRPDHVHFSIKGAAIASQLFYDAFMTEYLKFAKK